MAQITHGMNVEQVRQLGNLLKQKKLELDQLAQQVMSGLGRTSWEGPDAVAFRTQEWPAHRTRLAAIAAEIEAFGDLALRNAAEQEQASATSGGGGWRRGGPAMPAPGIPFPRLGDPGMTPPDFGPQEPHLGDPGMTPPHVGPNEPHFGDPGMDPIRLDPREWMHQGDGGFVPDDSHLTDASGNEVPGP